MRRIAFWSSMGLAALAVVWGAWFATFALGVPGEWEWNRVAPDGTLALSLVPPVVAAALYVGFVWLGERRIDRSRAAELSAWLGGVTICGFAWLWIVQESAPQSYQLSKAVWVLYFRGSSGYFSEARDAAADLPAYLAAYEGKMAAGDVLHIGTHPPGLVIIFRGLISLCARNSRLVDVVAASEPDSVRAAFEELRQTAVGSTGPVVREHEAVLWLATLLLQAGVALTVVPLFGLLRTGLSRRASWLAASFWPTVPALAVFIPKSDCLYPLVATGFLWLWINALDRRSLGFAAVSGFIFWVGLVLSLAFLPVAFLAMLITIDHLWRQHCGRPEASRQTANPPRNNDSQTASSAALKSCLAATACAGAGFAVPILLAWAFFEMNLVKVWWLNFHNHAAFYEHFSRTYWKWLLVNPLEFAVAAGAPLTVLAMWSIVRQWRLHGIRLSGHVWAWAATIGLVWLSGKNMGEAARLWILFIPFLVWFAGSLFEPSAASADDCRRAPPAGQLVVEDGSLACPTWIMALATQFATTILLVIRVVGFHYPDS